MFTASVLGSLKGWRRVSSASTQAPQHVQTSSSPLGSNSNGAICSQSAQVIGSVMIGAARLRDVFAGSAEIASAAMTRLFPNTLMLATGAGGAETRTETAGETDLDLLRFALSTRGDRAMPAIMRGDVGRGVPGGPVHVTKARGF